MRKNLESFIPMLLKTVQHNGGILDRWAAVRIFSGPLVDLAIAKGVVGKKTIILNANTSSPLRIPCITLDWDGKKPAWLERYNSEQKTI